MHRRAGRVFGALSVMAFAAFGPTGPALAVGTVAQTEPVGSLSVTPFGPYAAVEVAGPTAVAAATPTIPTLAATSTATAAAIVPPTAADGTGIPSTVLAAYKAAAASNPSCHLPWALLAGIGRVESGNAAGGRVDPAGATTAASSAPASTGPRSAPP